jgi:pyruvate formate lyase activating enzyme
MMNGILSDIKRMSVHDGPGIRTTLFLKGCPLRCLWCHNPENLTAAPSLSFTEKLCVGCGACAEACPQGVHSFENGVHHIEYDACKHCRNCVDECLPGALKLYGRSASAKETAKLLLEDADFYLQSGGGVTFSGGEPLLQSGFLREVMQILKEHDVHIAVDTCGAVAWSAFEDVLPYTNLFLYDLKHPDTQLHWKGTGAGNEQILENLEHLADLGVPVEIRTPVIPGYNDAEETLLQIAAILKKYQNITCWRLLPYHSMAKGKYEALGRAYLMPDTQMPDNTQMRALQRNLAAFYPLVRLSSDEME